MPSFRMVIVFLSYNIHSTTPLMGDHKIITATLGVKKPQPKITERRNWRNYSKTLLIELLAEIKFDLEITTVQELANDIENKITKVVDKMAPLSKFINNILEETTTHVLVEKKDNKIEFNWLNESLDSYKVKCKKLLL